MTRRSTFILVIFGHAILLTSCDRPECKNTNLIFDKYAPDSKEYKDELAKQLAAIDKSKLTYWMDSYQENEGSQFINAHIQGDGLCAKIVLTINDSNKGIQGILKKKGMGYRGAVLRELKFDVKQDSSSKEFIFQEISEIDD